MCGQRCIDCHTFEVFNNLRSRLFHVVLLEFTEAKKMEGVFGRGCVCVCVFLLFPPIFRFHVLVLGVRNRAVALWGNILRGCQVPTDRNSIQN